MAEILKRIATGIAALALLTSIPGEVFAVPIDYSLCAKTAPGGTPGPIPVMLPNGSTCPGASWPLYNAAGTVTQGFAYDNGAGGYCNAENGPHLGVDIGAPAGTPVVAIADGVVRNVRAVGDADTSFHYGNAVEICHPQATMTAYPGNLRKAQIDGSEMCSTYAHMQAKCPNITPGMPVKAGQVIGFVGTTGNSAGNHLHLMTHARSVIPNGVEGNTYDCPNSCLNMERWVNPLNFTGSTAPGSMHQFGKCATYVAPYCNKMVDPNWLALAMATPNGSALGSYNGVGPDISLYLMGLGSICGDIIEPWNNGFSFAEANETFGSRCTIPQKKPVILPLTEEITGAQPLMSAQLSANKNFRRKKTDVISPYKKFAQFLYQTSSCYKTYQDVAESLKPLEDQLRQINIQYNACLGQNNGSSAACSSFLTAMSALNTCGAPSSAGGTPIPALIFDCRVREELAKDNCPSLIGYASDLVDEFFKYGCPKELYIEAGEPYATSRKKLLQCVDYAIRRDRDNAVADTQTMLEPSQSVSPEVYANKYCQTMQVKSTFPPIPYFKWAGSAIDFSDASCQARISLYVTPVSGGKVPERILEPEPSSYAYNTADYDSESYPLLDIAKLNSETGTLCRPEFQPNTPEIPETRFNAQKVPDQKYLRVWLPQNGKSCPMGNRGNYATDHSDGFSPRHIEAFLNALDGGSQRSLPTCFVCGDSSPAIDPATNSTRWGTDQKTILALMRWTKPPFKRCIDCIRQCYFPQWDETRCVSCAEAGIYDSDCFINGRDNCGPAMASKTCTRCMYDPGYPEQTPGGGECCNSGTGGYCAESCDPPHPQGRERCAYPNSRPMCYDCPTNSESDCCQVADTDIFMNNPIKTAPKKFSWGETATNQQRIALSYREPKGGPKDVSSSPDGNKGRMTPIPEGFYFEEEFGWGNSLTSYDHRRRPYVRNFETNFPSCEGWNDAIIGIGDTESNCGYGGWEELKLYQLRCQREFGLKCLCKYESTFKRGSAEEYVHRRAGIRVSLKTEVIPSTLTKGDTVLQNFLDVDRFWPIGWRGYVSEPDPEYRFPALGLKVFSQNSIPPGNPNTGRGSAYPTNLTGLIDLAQNGIIKRGLSEAKPGDIIIWDRDVLWGYGASCGLAATGYVCTQFVDFENNGLPTAGSRRLPHVAYVQDAHTKKYRQAQCEARVAACQELKNRPGVDISKYGYCQRDSSGFDYASGSANCAGHPTVAGLTPDKEYVVIQETNNGKYPDVCGNTDRWGIEETRTLWNKLPSDKLPPADVRVYNPNGYCSEPQLRDCEENLWSKVKVYDPRRDVRSPKILAVPGLGLGGGDDRPDWDVYDAVSRTYTKTNIRNCADYKILNPNDINNSDANRFSVARAIYQGCDPPVSWRPPAGSYIPGVGEAPGSGTTGTLSTIATGRPEVGRGSAVNPYVGGTKPLAGKDITVAEPLTTRWMSYAGPGTGGTGPGPGGGGTPPPAPIDPGTPGCPTCCWPGQLPDEKVVTLCGNCTLSSVPPKTGNCCITVTTRVLGKNVYGRANACIPTGTGKICTYNEGGNIVGETTVATGVNGEGRVCEGGIGCITITSGTITVTNPGQGAGSGLKTDLRNLVNCAKRCVITNPYEDQYIYNWSELDKNQKSGMPKLPLWPTELRTSPFDYSDKNPFSYPGGELCKPPVGDPCLDAPVCFDTMTSPKQCTSAGAQRYLPFTPSHPSHNGSKPATRDSGYDRDYVLDYLYYYSRFFDSSQSGNKLSSLTAMAETPTIGWLYDPRLQFIPDQYMDKNPGMIFYKLRRYEGFDNWVNPPLAGRIITLKSIVESQNLPAAMPMSTPIPTVAMTFTDRYFRGQMALVYDYDPVLNCVDLIGANWLNNPGCYDVGKMRFDAHNCYQMNNSFGKGCVSNCVPIDHISFFWNPTLP